MKGRGAVKWPALVFVVVIAGALAPAAGANAVPHGQGKEGLRVVGSVSGSTLTVDLRGRAGSKCSEWLGSKKDRARLPGLYLGDKGRGRVKWDIPSETQTGDNRLKALCGYSGIRAAGHTTVDIPESAVSGTFSTVLNILLYVFLVASLAVFFFLLLRVVIFAPESERFPRALALIGGAVVALASEVAGIGFAEQLVESLASSSPVGEGVKLLAALIPGGAAVAFGWYFSYVLERSTYKAIRWMVLLGMLTLVTFAVILAEATKTNGVFLGAAAIPNASFVLGLIFSVLTFGGAEDESGGGNGVFQRVLGRFGLSESSGNPFAED
jgi:hypothetical protein